MEPPSQEEYFRSKGATTLMLWSLGTNDLNSLSRRSAKPGSMVVPPARTMFLQSSFRFGAEHCMMELKMAWCIPLDTESNRDGRKRASEQWKSSLPKVTVCPFGRV